jgi:hypothetical protein
MKRRGSARPKGRLARVQKAAPKPSDNRRAATSRAATIRVRERKAPAELTHIEANLLSEMQNGFELENSPLEGGLLLRKPKDNETLRPASVNLNTVKALEQRGLIRPVKSPDPLTTVWRVVKRER